MIENATGLVLRTRPLTETSLIVEWLTPEFGRLATVAKGARRPNSPFRAKLDLGYVAELSFSRSRRSELHTLREVKVRDTHRALRQEIGYLQQASYCTRLLEQATETETPLPAIYKLMLGMLDSLPAQPPRPQTVFAFELKLLDELGLAPDLDKTHLSPGAREVVRVLTEGDWALLGTLQLNERQSLELQRFLQGFLIYHLGKIPPGRDAALHASI